MKDSDKIKTIREELGMTQKELAEKLGISRAQVANIEQGIRFIKPRMERDLTTYLNVSPSWLSSGKGEVFLDKYLEFKLDEKEKEFLELYESLDEDSKQFILEAMQRIKKK